MLIIIWDCLLFWWEYEFKSRIYQSMNNICEIDFNWTKLYSKKNIGRIDCDRNKNDVWFAYIKWFKSFFSKYLKVVKRFYKKKTSVTFYKFECNVY